MKEITKNELIDQLLKIKDVNVTFIGGYVRGEKQGFNGYVDKNSEEPLSLWKSKHHIHGYLAGFETPYDAFRALQLADELFDKLNGE
jgi:hypothetical protein